VEPRDAEALAGALIRLLEDEGLRARMGAAGQARARELFTVERMVRDTAAVYDRVLAARGRRTPAEQPATHR
jgi:glycosyltransferase involved in cell wall biosynthesis